MEGNHDGTRGGGSPTPPAEGAPTSIDERWKLVLPYRTSLLAIATRRCPSPADAEDCVQEAMLRAARFERLDPRRVEQFLVATTVRLAIDLQRQRARSSRLSARLVETPDNAAPVDEAMLDSAEARWLAQRVADLPDRERAVLQRRLEGYNVTQTAEMLGVSYKSAESAFTRARNRLRAWAAAVGLLWIETGRWLRAHRGAPTGSALALASVGCLLIVAGVHHHGGAVAQSSHRGGPPRAGAPRTPNVPGPASAGIRPARSGGGASGSPAKATVVRASTNLPPAADNSTTLVWVQPQPGGPSVGVERHGRGLNPIPTLENCLAGGPSLDPSTLVC